MEQHGTLCSIFLAKRKPLPLLPPSMNPEIQLLELLQSVLDRRSASNPSYSLRALARDAKVPVSRLSEFMQGRRQLSARNVARVFENLKLDSDLRDREILRAQIKMAKSKTRTVYLKKRLDQIRQNRPRVEVSLQQFAACSDWIHLGVLELLSWNQNWSISKLAERLGVDEAIVQRALKRLAGLGLVEVKTGVYKALKDKTLVAGGVPSEAIRNFHSGLIHKALASLETQSIGERTVRSMIFSLGPDDLPVLNTMIEEFLESVAKRFAAQKPQSRLYAISSQAFALDKRETKQGDKL